MSILRENKSYHPDGSIRSIDYRDQDGAIEGRSQLWHPNGQLWADEFYRHSEKIGEHKRWYDNGQMEYLEFYDKGALFGQRKEWYKNGNTKSVQYMGSDYRDTGHYQGQKWNESGVLIECHSGRALGLDVFNLENKVEILETSIKKLEQTLQEQSSKRDAEIDEKIDYLNKGLHLLDDRLLCQTIVIGIILAILLMY